MGVTVFILRECGFGEFQKHWDWREPRIRTVDGFVRAERKGSNLVRDRHAEQGIDGRVHDQGRGEVVVLEDPTSGHRDVYLVCER